MKTIWHGRPKEGRLVIFEAQTHECLEFAWPRSRQPVAVRSQGAGEKPLYREPGGVFFFSSTVFAVHLQTASHRVTVLDQIPASVVKLLSQLKKRMALIRLHTNIPFCRPHLGFGELEDIIICPTAQAGAVCEAPCGRS